MCGLIDSDGRNYSQRFTPQLRMKQVTIAGRTWRQRGRSAALHTGGRMPVCYERRLRRDKAAWPHGRSKRAVDLSHQTIAAWPETRRGSAETGGRAAGAWRSWARRPGRHADREPKGASFRILLLVLAIDANQLRQKRDRQTKLLYSVSFILLKQRLTFHSTLQISGKIETNFFHCLVFYFDIQVIPAREVAR